MPITLSNLDDLTYDELVEDALAGIPALYPGWTDHNASDPGIALVELFAWLSEMLIYRTSQIPDESYQVFLRILNGPGWTPPADQDLEEIIHATMRKIRSPYRAVTPEDYATLVADLWPMTPASATLEPVKRVLCLAEQDLEGADPTAAAPGHMSVLVASATKTESDPWGATPSSLLDGLRLFFANRRVITTRLHVTGPTFVGIKLSARLYLDDDADEVAVVADAHAALVAHFHPWRGGPDGRGWPFGRSVREGDVGAALDRVRGVDFADGIVIEGTSLGAPAPVLRAHELARVDAKVAGPLVVPGTETLVLSLFQRREQQWVQL